MPKKPGNCVAPDCNRSWVYATKRLCQKHYVRLRRNGTLGLVRKPAQERVVAPNGYVRVHRPGHPLAASNGYVFEHRLVAYETRGGVLSFCERCRVVPITWKTCHVDHDDRDRTNNAPWNLLATCVGCNTQRHAKKRGATLTARGETKAITDWARDPRVVVGYNAIRGRKRRGASDEDAVFGARQTHRGSPPAKVRACKFENGSRKLV